jgi:hypothetical protein
MEYAGPSTKRPATAPATEGVSVILIALAVFATVQVRPSSDTVPDPVAMYAPVIEDLRARARAQNMGAPVVLEEAVFVNVGRGPAPPKRWHAAGVLRRLRHGGWIQGTCRIAGSRTGCRNQHGALNLRLGDIIGLPDSASVRIEDPPFGIASEVRDSSRVPVASAVDVVVSMPCRRCSMPGARSYRYFLRRLPGGKYGIATRVLTGAT